MDTRIPTSAAGRPPAAPAVPLYPLSLRVNGQEHQLHVEAWVSLLDLLRDRLALTGTKKGCDQGQCGACTVLVDGKRINSCLTLALMQEGRSVTTVEGLADGAALHPLQQAFIKHDAFQCGYCTPGQLCSGVGLINEGQAQDCAQVRELMSGNVCRCGAYPQIVAAMAEVMQLPDERHGQDRDDHAGARIGTVPA